MSESQGLCMTCRFFESEGEHVMGEGNCKRNPPIACYDSEGDCGVSVWPLVTWTDWCGEYVRREDDDAEDDK